ncbi:MoaD/ThiS family protein [Plantactinospora sonchi]|uniref:MoaD/ThiS family protein n=1 Tax=Plantactinospora sonchi TaxID=1544735 RepID=A0ABU7RPH8_9ACTN
MTVDGAATRTTVVVRYFAAARAAAGVAEETVPGGRNLDELVGDLTRRHGEQLGRVLSLASFLVDGVACHDRQAPLPAGTTVDVLPPFAGG